MTVQSMDKQLYSTKRPLIPALWGFLTRVHPRITDIEMRRQSGLLAGLMLALVVFRMPPPLFVGADDLPYWVRSHKPVPAFLNCGYYRWTMAVLAQNFVIYALLGTNQPIIFYHNDHDLVLLLPARASDYSLSLAAQLAIGN
jgi:hypothetical protein